MRQSTLYITVLIMFLSACGNGNNSRISTDTGDDADENIIISREQFEASNLAFAGIKEMDVSESVDATGVVKVYPDNRAIVTALVDGRVARVFVSQGEWVDLGRRLLEIEGPSIVELQQKFSEVNARLPVLKADFERQKGLYQDQISSEKVFLEARSLYKEALARWSGLRKQLQLIGVDTDRAGNADFVSSVIITAPVGGNITDMDAIPGMHFNSGIQLLQIADPDAVYVELNVFENDFSGIREGLKVDIFPIGNSAKRIEGTIKTISHKVDDLKRSISIHVSLGENEGNLLPGMYVDAEIQKNTTSMFVLPREAVVELDGGTFALMRIEENDSSFVLRQVELEVTSLEEEQVGILNHEAFARDVQFLSKDAFSLIVE